MLCIICYKLFNCTIFLLDRKKQHNIRENSSEFIKNTPDVMEFDIYLIPINCDIYCTVLQIHGYTVYIVNVHTEHIFYIRKLTAIATLIVRYYLYKIRI